MESVFVVKVGTNILTGADGILDAKNIKRLAAETNEIIEAGLKVIIVSSGAVGAGCGSMGILPDKLSLSQKQAMASIGQTSLMEAYAGAFSLYGKKVGQILLTSSDFSDRKSYLNIRNTLFALLKMKVIPVVNENDSVAADEIKVGDNDRLAALVASKIGAEKLILLSNIKGFMDSEGRVIKEIKKIDSRITSLVKKKISRYGVGGMETKLEAAKIFSRLCGGDTYLTDGRTPGVLKEILTGANPGTVFKSSGAGLKCRKRWIAQGIRASGSLVLDRGAVKALKDSNASLLPVGIKEVKGNFAVGDKVNCLDGQGRIIARGLVNFSSKELRKIKGKNTAEIKKIPGWKNYDEAIHRDNMVAE